VGQQFGLRAALEDAAVLQHQDLIHIFQPDQPVGDEQERAAARQGKERVEDAALGQRVEVGCRFIRIERIKKRPKIRGASLYSICVHGT
jgi:hypothetical protein